LPLPRHNDSARQVAKDILKDIQANTSIYFGTLTVVNICLGIATGLVACVHINCPGRPSDREHHGGSRGPVAVRRLSSTGGENAGLHAIAADRQAS
jgi:hypothetical protein